MMKYFLVSSQIKQHEGGEGHEEHEEETLSSFRPFALSPFRLFVLSPFRPFNFIVGTILILLFTGCATTAEINRTTYTSPANNRLWTSALRDSEEINRYQVNIQVKGNNITGMCMLKKSDEGWRGTLINEFGVKAFDFIITPKKCKLLNTIAMMNKWYIRNTIADDLHFLFEIDNPTVSFQSKTTRIEQDGTLIIALKKKKSITLSTDNSLTLYNLKRKIVYSLNKIPQ
jgi:hypothetical protein